MKTVTFLAGAGGSGKSFVLANRQDLQGQEVVNLDHFIEAHPSFLSGEASAADLFSWAKGLRDQAWAKALEGDESFILDGTCADLASVQKRVEQAYQAGFQVRFLWVKVPVELCLYRNTLRPRQVPTEAILEASVGCANTMALLVEHGFQVEKVNNFTWAQALEAQQALMLKEVVWA